MQKFRRFIAIGLIAAIAAVGPPVTAQAQDTAYNEVAPITIENVAIVVDAPTTGIDTIGFVTITLVLIERPTAVPTDQIAEASEPPNADAVSPAVPADRITDFMPNNMRAVQPMPVEPSVTGREAFRRSRTMIVEAVASNTIVNPPIVASTSLLHLNL